MQAERAELRPEVAREFVGPVDFRGDGRDLVVGEGAHRLAHLIGGLVHSKVEQLRRIGEHGGVPPDRMRWCTAFCGEGEEISFL